MAPASEHSGRSAVVTGAGGGLGRDIALGLAAKGYIVFGTAFSAGEVSDLKEASGGRVSLTVCDITKEQAVKTWAAGVSEALGSSGLDLLINNAGILTPGPLEVLPLDAIRHEFDVNVFGALSVMNAFLPALRKARGRIVQVSTWTASVPLPFNGPSGASKAAMEVFATVYRAELKRFGIDVVVAAAGNMKTGGPAKTAAALKRVADGMTPEQRELYGQTFATFAAALNGMQNSGLEFCRRRPESDRAGRASARAEPRAGGSGCRRDAPGRSREIRRRARCVAPPARRPELDPLENHPLQKEPAMIEIIDVNDSRAVRNKDNVLALYDLMINKKKSEEATAKFVSPAYIQHNPLIADGSVALGKFFGQVTRERAQARVVVHRIIAVGDYVWAHVNFLNLFNDDPDDTGIAGVDIYKLDADGKAIEHWDTLQLVGDPKNSAPMVAPNIPRANPNGMF